MWVYQRVDVLYFGYSSHFGVNSIVVQSLRISGNRYFVLLDTEQITGYRHLCDDEYRTDHRTDCWIQWTNLTVNYMDKIVVRSDWFHYYNIVIVYELFRIF